MNLSFSKKGFTFSEALLTLVIIGVVAGLTIPFIYANYTAKIRNVKVKKFHKLMNDALDAYTEDYYGEKMSGGGNYSGLISGKVAALKPYLPIAKDCGFEIKGCTYDGKYRYMNGDEIVSDYYNSSGIWYNMLLDDGSQVHVHNLSISTIKKNGNTTTIDYDINGSSPPNRVGYDIFRFEIIWPKNRMVPHYSRINNILYDGGDIVDDCNKNDLGFSCAAKILNNVKY